MTRHAAGLSAEHTKAGRLQRALLDLLGVHERQGTLPTSIRFLFYELIQAGVVLKAATGARRADQDTIEALTYLREVGLVSWEWIVDETRRTPNRFRPVGFPGHSDRTRTQVCGTT